MMILMHFLLLILLHSIAGFIDFENMNHQSSRGAKIVLDQNVKIGQYFEYMDSLIAGLDTMLPYPIDENALIQHNHYVIDRLVATDYDSLRTKGQFAFDQRELIVLHKNDTLFIPASNDIVKIMKRRAATIIDINIPEFRLRIMEDEEELYSFEIRVGKNTERYLSTIDKTVDLKTKTGTGKIIRIEKNPNFVDPVSGNKYLLTTRDDGKQTRMPLIPWLEPEINSQRHGQLIHPTTNPSTLGRAYSNGCIGTRESDAWRLYYYAPLGTQVHIRYDLRVRDEQGNTIEIPDIYKIMN